jgi:hypothetical protein
VLEQQRGLAASRRWRRVRVRRNSDVTAPHASIKVTRTPNVHDHARSVNVQRSFDRAMAERTCSHARHRRAAASPVSERHAECSSSEHASVHALDVGMRRHDSSSPRARNDPRAPCRRRGSASNPCDSSRALASPGSARRVVLRQRAARAARRPPCLHNFDTALQSSSGAHAADSSISRSRRASVT